MKEREAMKHFPTKLVKKVRCYFWCNGPCKRIRSQLHWTKLKRNNKMHLHPKQPLSLEQKINKVKELMEKAHCTAVKVEQEREKKRSEVEQEKFEKGIEDLPTKYLLEFGQHLGLTLEESLAIWPEYIPWCVSSNLHKTYPLFGKALREQGLLASMKNAGRNQQQQKDNSTYSA